MKRSEINSAVQEAEKTFERHFWILPPEPRWDVTDFGLGDFSRKGLVLINLAEEPEYCEKIMYVRKGQVTPRHYHKQKKEDIICRFGRLAVRFFSDEPCVSVQINGTRQDIPAEEELVLESGWRVTLEPYMDHEFYAQSDYAIVGEVSTANDDTADNFFADPEVGRFSEIEEDEPPIVSLVSD